MRIRVGWSGETQSNRWEKVDVELEEEDLQRLVRENGFPEDLHNRLPVKVCFQLLQNEAEVLLLSKLKMLGYPIDKASARMAVLMGSTQEIVGQIRERLAVAA